MGISLLVLLDFFGYLNEPWDHTVWYYSIPATIKIGNKHFDKELTAKFTGLKKLFERSMVFKPFEFKLTKFDCILLLSFFLQGFQYFSSLSELHYLQVVLFIEIWTIVINMLYNNL